MVLRLRGVFADDADPAQANAERLSPVRTTLSIGMPAGCGLVVRTGSGAALIGVKGLRHRKIGDSDSLALSKLSAAMSATEISASGFAVTGYGLE